MFCENCGNPLTSDSRFCNRCGSVVSVPVAPPGAPSAQPARSAQKSERRLLTSHRNLVAIVVLAVIAAAGITIYFLRRPTSGKLYWATFRGNPQRSGAALASTRLNRGRILWTYPLRSVDKELLFGTNEPLIGSDGTVYVATPGLLTAISGTGQLKWQAALKYHGAVCALAPDETIIAASSSGGERFSGPPANVSKFGPDGTMRWSTDVNTVITDIAVAPSGTIYVAGRLDITAISTKGKVQWRYLPRNYDIEFRRYIGLDNKIALGPDEKVYAFVPDIEGNENRTLLVALSRKGILLNSYECTRGGEWHGGTLAVGRDWVLHAHYKANSRIAEALLLNSELMLQSRLQFSEQQSVQTPFAIQDKGQGLGSSGEQRPGIFHFNFFEHDISNYPTPSGLYGQAWSAPTLDVDGDVPPFAVPISM